MRETMNGISYSEHAVTLTQEKFVHINFKQEMEI